MSYIQGVDRNQMCLPSYIEDMVSSDNPIRVVDAFVDSLDLLQVGFSKNSPASTGRPAYNPKDLLKLYIYGYFNRIRSSRKLMLECTRNIELFFLLCMLTPDFRTIADFRKENAKAIRNVFREFTKLCINLKLYESELLAIDGSKFRAVNGNKKMYNDEILKSKLDRIDNKLNEYLQRMDELDTLEEEPLLEQKDTLESGENEKYVLNEKIQILNERKELYESYRKEIKESGEKQKLVTDPEARMMHSHKDGFHCCYNIQTAVDSKNHIIWDYQVTNHVNDQGILLDFSRQIKSTVNMPFIKLLADKGYDCKEEILNCIMDGNLAYVGFKDDKEERLFTIDYIPKTITDKMKASNKTKDIRACLHAGIFPKVYENANLAIEVKNIGEVGAFTRGDDKSFVTCPMGNTLHKTKEKNNGMVYVSRPACRQCTNRCTPSKRHKEVFFGPESSCVAARMYGNEKAINLPPSGFKPTNSFYKKNPIERTVLIRMRDDVSKQKERLCISEHPFGTVKWYHGAHYVLCKSIEKVTAELGLSFLAYNLRRAINLVGTERILRELRG